MSSSKSYWDRQRQAAIRLCRELHLEEELETARRSWISKTWPCPSILSGSQPKHLLDDRFTPEWPLSSASENFIRNFVRRSFNEFLEDDDGLGLLLEELSDAEVVKGLPFLLRGLNVRALQEVLSTLSTCPLKRAMNRGWLESKISEKLREVRADDAQPVAEPVEQVIAIVRDPRSARKYNPVGFLADLPSLPAAAAEDAFTKLDKLSLQTLRVMYEVIGGNEPSQVCLLKAKYLGNKDRYMSTIRKHAANFVVGESLPPTLQKALLVMSLSARATVGEDGNLGQCVDKQYRGSEALQNQMLLAHSRIHKLDPHQLETAYLEITLQTKEDIQSRHPYFDINSGDKRESQRKHPNDFRQSLRRILFDYIIRSGMLQVPGHVRQAVATVNSAADKKQSHKSHKGKRLLKLKQQFDDEVACVAHFSTQLRDLIVDGCTSSVSQDVDGPGVVASCWMDPESPAENDDHGLDATDTESTDELDSQFSDAPLTDCPTHADWSNAFSSGPDTAAHGTVTDDADENDDAGEGDRWLGVSGTLLHPSDSDSSSVGARHDHTPHGPNSSEVPVLQSEAGSVDVESRPQPVDMPSGSDSEDSSPIFFTRDDGWGRRHHPLDADAPQPSQASPSFLLRKAGYTEREQKRQRVADKAAVLMYTFVGRAMEEAASRPGSALLDPAQKYLAGGFAAHGHDQALKNLGVNEPAPGDEMLLKIVETLPAMSKRVLEAVKQRMSFG